MANEQWTWTYEERFDSRHGAGIGFQEEVLRQLDAGDWVEAEVFAIRLAMEEAFANAIKHGNEHDTEKSVHATCRLSADRIQIEVTDEGSGFRPEDVPDPTLEERLEEPSGRGIMLMRSFMCRVEFNEAGNRVIMEKQRGATG